MIETTSTTEPDKSKDTKKAVSLSGVKKGFVAPFTLSKIFKLTKPAEIIEVLKDINLEINHGEIVGLLGANGSGKSTLLRIMSGLLLADAGKVHVLGVDPADESERIKGKIGVVLPNERSFYWRLTLRRNIEFFATLNDMTRAEIKEKTAQVIDKVGLFKVIDRPFRDLSDGMKQRAAMARGLINEPDLLLLDEATRSLDPGGSNRILDIIREYAEKHQTAVLMVSHNLEEISQVSDRIALLADGKIEMEDKPENSMDAIKKRLQDDEARLSGK